MEIREFDRAVEQERAIRTDAFVMERNYRREFDEWDEPGRATHLLAFDGERSVATCRLFADPEHADQPGRWVIARLAVVPEHRGQGIGGMMLAEAERRIKAAGGTICAVHAEEKNFPLYEHLGYALTDEIWRDDPPHGWMIKHL